MRKTNSRRAELPDATVLRERFSYCPDTGALTTKRATKMKAAGEDAAHVTPAGYRRVCMPEGVFFAHRIAWKMVTGMEPPAIIDHADGNGLNNRWHNLREADDVLNAQNAKTHSDNKAGAKGVSLCAATGKWTAFISTGGKNRFLGRFDLKDAAAEAYAEAARVHFGGFARVAA